MCIAPQSMISQSDRYLHFDGIDDFAELPNASQYFTGASGVSMTGWFCSPALGYGHGYFGFRGPGNGDGQMYVIELGGGNLECRYISSGGFFEYVSTGTVQPNVWQHVAWTHNGTTSSLYINGQFVGSTPSSGTFNATTRSFGIGKSIENGFNFVFGGRIDEVSVWSKGLSQAEIQDIMANELLGTEAELQLYYKMDQGVPGGNNTGISQLVSEVGGGTRDADLINFSMSGPTSNFNNSAEDPSFTVSDHCPGAFNEATILGTPGGTFSFAAPVSDGATIDGLTGSISNGVAGTTYSIQYTTNGPCPISESHDVLVYQVDDPSFSLTDFCSGTANSASAISTTGGTFSLDPDPLDGTTIDAATGELSNGIPGITYSISYTTNGPCPDTHTNTVTVLGSPTIGNLLEECTADELTYTVSFDISGGEPGSYSVTGAGTLTGNTFTSDPIPSGDPYDFTVSDGFGCGTDQVMGDILCVCVSGATMSGDISMCEGEFGNIELTLTGTAPWTISYTLDNIAQTDIVTSANPFNLQVNLGGSYQFTSISDVDCTSSLTQTAPVTVTIIPLPEATISGNESICSGESSSFEIDLQGTGPWDLSYAIEGIAQGPLNINSSPYTLPADQEGTYTIVNLSDTLCTGSGNGSAELTVHDLPTASISDDITFCDGDQASIEVTLTGTANYSLGYTLNGVDQPALTVITPSSYSLLTSTEGTYELTTLSDANCTGSVSGIVTLTEQELPTATLESGSFIICDGDAQELSVDLTGDPNWELNYTLDGIPQAAITSSTSPISITANQEGTYELLSISDALCSNSTGSAQVDISFHPPIQIDFPSDVEICVGETAEVWVEASGGLGNAYSYDWSISDLVTSSDGVAIYSPSSTTQVTVTVNEDCNYNTSFQIPITVHQLPPISIGGEFVRCGEGSILLINETPSGYIGDTCIWVVDGVEYLSCDSLLSDFGIGTYDVELSITSPQGCFNSLESPDLIEVNPAAEALFSFEPTEPTSTAPIVWFTNLSTEADQYEWSFGQGTISTEADPHFDFGPQRGEYDVCLIADTDQGCMDSLCQTIRITNEVFVLIPNSFTPNDDGVNDLFFPVLNGIDVEDYEFSIYDRDGHRVFMTHDVERKWNGSYPASQEYFVSDNLYTWRLLVKALGSSDKQEYVGTVLMIR